MGDSIFSLLPDPEALLELEPEELAGVVLQHLNSLQPMESGQLNRHNFGLVHTVGEYPRAYHESASKALMEAWVWLEREGLLAPKPGDTGDWFFITRRGETLTTEKDVAAYRRGNLLPRGLLHPRIAQKTWATFLRGDYDTAVFQAFKEVEVAVRSAAKLPTELVGVKLMRKAFHTETGALADKDLPAAEREGMLALFAGSIGLYKNPASHRDVVLGPEETVELLMLGTHLLSIVDACKDRQHGEV